MTPTYRRGVLSRAPRALIHDAKNFVAQVELSAKRWTEGNNSGDAAVLATKDAEHLEHARNAERIAAKYRCSCDWPGLYPVVKSPDGREEYGTADYFSVLRAFNGGDFP